MAQPGEITLDELQAESIVKNKRLQKISEIYSDKELEAIAKGGRIVPGMDKVPIIDFSGQRIRFGALGDTHFGSIYTDPAMWESALKEFKKEKIDFICHVGDLTEGMSNRPDHIYQLSHIGYAAQKSHAREMLQLWDKKIFVISGNHDRWFIKNAGADIIEDATDGLKNVEYIGHDEGNISLKGKASIRLWHGEDGNSYAKSYRIQKVVESLTGGEKPNIMLFGHTHKQLYMLERNIHCVSTGSIQKQSKWMRAKRILAETGFWIIDAWVAKKGIAKITTTFYPFYQ